jgi:predicted DNA-binding transcriptional regulator AlpA
MKNTYNIEEFMQVLEVDSRSTFWRMRKAKAIPEPDIKSGHPRWLRATIEPFLPKQNTNPST